MILSKKKLLLLVGFLFLVLIGLQACTSDPPVVVSKGSVVTTGSTFTPTPCGGILGTNVIEPTPVVGTTYIWFNPYVCASTGSLQSLSTYTASSNPTTYELGIYNSNGTGTLPATLLGQTGSQIIGPVTQWSRAFLTTSVNLSSGVTYWLALHSSLNFYTSGGVTYAYQSIPGAYGSLPTTYSGSSPVAPYTFSLYGTTCP